MLLGLAKSWKTLWTFKHTKLPTILRAWVHLAQGGHYGLPRQSVQDVGLLQRFPALLPESLLTGEAKVESIWDSQGTSTNTVVLILSFNSLLLSPSTFLWGTQSVTRLLLLERKKAILILMKYSSNSSFLSCSSSFVGVLGGRRRQ